MVWVYTARQSGYIPILYVSLRLEQSDLISQTWKIQTFALGELDRHDKPLHLQSLIRTLLCSSMSLNICHDNRRVRSDCAEAHARPGIRFLRYAKLWISHPESKDNNLSDTFWTIHSKDLVQNVYYTWKEVTNKSFLANFQVGHYLLLVSKLKVGHYFPVGYN